VCPSGMENEVQGEEREDGASDQPDDFEPWRPPRPCARRKSAVTSSRVISSFPTARSRPPLRSFATWLPGRLTHIPRDHRAETLDASNPKPSAESVIVLSSSPASDVSVAAPAIVCLGMARADHRTQPLPAPRWDHSEFPHPPCDERVEAGARLRNAEFGSAPCAWARWIWARGRVRHCAWLA
jgi:hypothetical protein